MISFILVFFLIVFANALLLEDQRLAFKEFKLEHGKTYTNQAEESKRFDIFSENLRLIKEHNILYAQRLTTWKQRVNKFADMTKEELSAMLGTHSKPAINGTKYVESKLVIPSSIDWRTLGQVTEVKEQGVHCGSCWAFSVAGSTEAAYYRKTGKLVSLSEQQLLDCFITDVEGCRGGYLEGTFPYIQQNGLEAESEYPYEAKEVSCRFKSSKVVTKVSNYTVLTSGDEGQLLNAVGTVGPISVTIDAQDDLWFYESGVYSNNNCTISINHAVLAVGYDSEPGVDYWLIKNSWGSGWGENGYFKLLRGKNMCGIAQETVYPVIN